MAYLFDNGAAIERLIQESGHSFSDDTLDKHLKEAQAAIADKGAFDGDVERYGRNWLNGFLAFVYAAGLVLLANLEQSKRLLKAWSDRQIQRPKPKANVWYPMLVLFSGRFDPMGEKVSFGKKDKKQLQTKFLRHDSMLKYAGSLAYMQSQGVTAADAVQYLTEHTPNGLLEKYRAGLDPSKKRKTYSDDELKSAKKLPALPLVALAEKPVEAGENDFVEAVCVWDELSGQVRIVGFVKDSGARARNRAIALAKQSAENAENDAEAAEFFETHGVS